MCGEDQSAERLGIGGRIHEPGALRLLDEAAAAVLPGSVTTTATEYVGRLATVSAYLTLEPEVRTEALRQVRAVLPERLEIDSTVQLSLARRA